MKEQDFDLEDEELDKALRQYQKQLEEVFVVIDKPYTFEKCLKTLKKDDLLSMGRRFGLKGMSSKNKTQIASSLAEDISHSFDEFLNYLDHERMTYYIEARDNEGVVVYDTNDFENSPLYMATQYFLFPSIVDNEHVLILPDELMSFLTEEKLGGKKAVFSRNEEWIRFMKGIINLYGFIPLTDLVKLLGDYYGEDFDSETFAQVIMMAQSYYLDYFLVDEGFIHADVENEVELIDEISARSDLSYYQPSLSTILAFGAEGWLSDHKSVKEFKYYLEQTYHFEVEHSEIVVDEFVYMIKEGFTLQEIINHLSSYFGLENDKQLDQIMKFYQTINNTTRLWVLKGHSPDTLQTQKKSSLNVLSEKKGVTPVDFENKKKIGRNDPCFCGSGKKYKYCCGK